MSYQKAVHILPAELLRKVQEYVDGETLYIPRVPDKKRKWGTGTTFRSELAMRDRQIYQEYVDGASQTQLQEKFYLSEKSIQRILRRQRELK